MVYQLKVKIHEENYSCSKNFYLSCGIVLYC
jgi:hypothetical protein